MNLSIMYIASIILAQLILRPIQAAEPLLLHEPIAVSSDSAEIRQDEGLAIHRGHVLLDQGDRHITSDVLEVMHDKGGALVEIHAIGNPARFDVTVTNGAPAWFGTARSIRYLPKSNALVLEKEAELHREDHVVYGPLIRYDLLKKVATTAENPTERTKMILQPK